MPGRVSIILPTFNRAHLIAETLDSLLSQTRPADEILLVDDGSSDATPDVIAPYRDRLTYIRKENGGKASALNLAMEQARGDYIWINDDDDLIERDACERLAGALDADPGLGFAAGRHEDFIIDPETGAQVRKAPGYWRASQPDEIFSHLLDGCHIFQPGLIVRRSVYDALGGFNLKLTRAQDYEMMLRIARHARGVLFPDLVFLHREHAGPRGSAAERFSTEESNARWIAFHRMIFTDLLASLSDAELMPARIYDAPENARVADRIARLKRASVQGRHVMWPEALQDFARAAALHPGTPLNALETELVTAATGYSFGCAPLYEDADLRARMLALKQVSPAGRAIAGTLGRSLQWRIKEATRARRLSEAASLTRLVAQARI